eukprot:416224_1
MAVFLSMLMLFCRVQHAESSRDRGLFNNSDVRFLPDELKEELAGYLFDDPVYVYFNHSSLSEMASKLYHLSPKWMDQKMMTVSDDGSHTSDSPTIFIARSKRSIVFRQNSTTRLFRKKHDLLIQINVVNEVNPTRIYHKLWSGVNTTEVIHNTQMQGFIDALYSLHLEDETMQDTVAATPSDVIRGDWRCMQHGFYGGRHSD